MQNAKHQSIFRGVFLEETSFGHKVVDLIGHNSRILEIAAAHPDLDDAEIFLGRDGDSGDVLNKRVVVTDCLSNQNIG